MSALPFAPDLIGNFHTKALQPFCDLRRYNDRLFKCSLWTRILLYNRLPQALVHYTSVKTFQAKLTALAKMRAQQNIRDWRKSFQDCVEINAMFHD